MLRIAALPHLRNIVTLAFQHDLLGRALLVFDSQCELASELAAAYRELLPTARHIDFDSTAPESIMAAFAELDPGSLVILVQSSSFRLAEFRLRIELFQRGLKVIEHVHLARMPGEQPALYVDSLAYDPEYLHHTGLTLKDRLDNAASGLLDTGEFLYMDGPFEIAMHNIGDYSQRKNFGGQFPIGEVFTEAKELECVHGKVRIFAYGDSTFEVIAPPDPVTLIVEQGRVVGAENQVAGFAEVLESIRAEEGEVWVRELGFGLNRAFTRDKRVSDIGTYERMCGVHLSLGAKHPIYPKPQFSRRKSRFHVDVFADTREFQLDGQVVYRSGEWTVGR